jgi:hypothetical protein
VSETHCIEGAESLSYSCIHICTHIFTRILILFFRDLISKPYKNTKRLFIIYTKMAKKEKKAFRRKKAKKEKKS